MNTTTATQKAFKVGQKVTWKSGANGSMKTKSGKVVGVIKAGGAPGKKFGAFGGKGRTATSYVIDVGGKFYWPHASLLKG